MDKLAPAIAWIKKNSFWLGCAILLASMLGSWFYQTSSLGADLEKNERDIKSKFSAAKGISNKKPDDLSDTDVRMHPNQASQDGMTAELEKTVNSIVAAWRLRVDRQKDLLVFPAVIGQKKFSDVFARYNPPETFPVEYVDFQVDALLSLYRDKVQDHMINIAGKDGVRTNWLLDPENYEQEDDIRSRSDGFEEEFDVFDGGGNFNGETNNEDAARFAVLWSEINQQLWQAKLTTFQDRDDHSKESNDPTPLQCFMLQQDLWLLEAMFNIIRSLNGNSVSTDTSAIKQIDHIAFGREGNVKLGELHPVDARLGPKDDSSEESLGAFDEGLGGLGADTAGYEKYFSEEEKSESDEYGIEDDLGDEELVERNPPFHELYVDANFEPISAEEVLAVVKGEEIPENHLELLIAKRVPVRVGLRMDERKIADFMAACANSPFAFEIQQVRINRHQAGGEPIELAGGGASSSFRGFGDDFGERDATSKFDDVEPIETRTTFDVNVEFFGIVKIYNPVREDLLRKAVGLEPIEAAEADGDDEGSADVPVEAANQNSQDTQASLS